MLSAPAPFPHPGCAAFERGTGAEVRIIQADAEGNCLVTRLDREAGRSGALDTNASGNTRIARVDLFPTRAEAIATGHPKAKRTRAKVGA